MKQIPQFLRMVGPELANKYCQYILPEVEKLAKDNVRLFPDAPNAVGQSLEILCRYYFKTEQESVLRIVDSLVA